MTAASRFDRRARWARCAAAVALLLCITALWLPVPQALSLTLYVVGAAGAVWALSAAALWSARADLDRWDARSRLCRLAISTVVFDRLERAKVARRARGVR